VQFSKNSLVTALLVLLVQVLVPRWGPPPGAAGGRRRKKHTCSKSWVRAWRERE